MGRFENVDVFRTLELENRITATDVYWGDGKQLDVVVVVNRHALKEKWNETQRVFQQLTRFSLRTLVLGVRTETQEEADRDN